MKRCLASLAIREKQTKITMRYHFTPLRMAIINHQATSAGEVMEKREPQCTVGGNADWGRSLWKTLWHLPTKLNMKLPFDSAIPLLELYPKPESPIQKNLCTPIFIAVLFTIAKCQKQPKCPSVNEWIKKRWYIHTMEYYAAVIKRKLF